MPTPPSPQTRSAVPTSATPAPPERGVGRVVLLSTSPRVAPGLLSWPAWQVLHGARVFAPTGDHPQLPALAAAGVAVTAADTPGSSVPAGPRDRADWLLRQAADGTVVWLLPVTPYGAAAADDEATDGLLAALAEATRQDVDAAGEQPRVEVLTGAVDLPGAHVLDLVAVMDRLRSPGGCPWDAQQTHRSLVTYLLEEAYETVEAIEGEPPEDGVGGDGAGEPAGEGVADRTALREELGDVLLQVAFHSRIAQEDAADPFGFDDLADRVVAKLVARHPHVFGSTSAPTADHVAVNWDRIKAAEKNRTSAADGVPFAQPALSLAAKLAGRVDRAGLAVPVAAAPSDLAVADPAAVGEHLLAVAVAAHAAGVDPEAALRAAARGYRSRLRDIEKALRDQSG